MQTCKLLSNDTVLLSQPKLIEEFGRAGAHFLSQLHYWLQHSENLGVVENGVRWIYNSAKDWADQLRLNDKHVQRIVSKLKNIGVIQVRQLSPNRYNRTNYYSINYEVLEQLFELDAPRTAETFITAKCGNAPSQNAAMNIQRLPYKDFNKSEETSAYAKASADKQVKDLNLKIKKTETEFESNELNSRPTAPVVTVQQEGPALVVEITQEPQTEGTLTCSKPKTFSAQDMLKIWNASFVGKAEAQTKLTKVLVPLLVAAFKTKFASDLANWQNYCEQLRSSEYLMRDSFKLTIGWALKFATIDRIRAGDLGVKISEAGGCNKTQSSLNSDQQIIQMIDDLAESNTAKALRLKIAQAIGTAAYFSWFHQAKVCDESKALRLVAPNAFVEQYWETHFCWVNKMADKQSYH